MKFSIIVPVYNVEKYIKKCLESIINQTYKNFEAIIVNDGTKDNSQIVIDEYVKKDKRIKSYIKENGGLSDARNYGLKHVTGDYILFADSDDWLDLTLLEKLNEEVSTFKADIIRYSYNTYSENSNYFHSYDIDSFSNLSCEEAINKLLTYNILEPAWLYAFNTKFWNKNKFEFVKGKIHEDYGLIPYTLTKAKSISSIDVKGYNYLIRTSSITNGNNEDKKYKNACDVLEQFKLNIDRIGNSLPDVLIKSFLANGVLNQSKMLSKKYLNEYYKEINKMKVIDFLATNTLKRKIKKLYISFCLKFNIYIRS